MSNTVDICRGECKTCTRKICTGAKTLEKPVPESVYMAPLPKVARSLNIREIKAAFIKRGDSLHAWAFRNGYNPVHVFRSIRGDYSGPKALRVLADLEKAFVEASK